jgi:hypothetical protein
VWPRRGRGKRKGSIDGRKGRRREGAYNPSGMEGVVKLVPVNKVP